MKPPSTPLRSLGITREQARRQAEAFVAMSTLRAEVRRKNTPAPRRDPTGYRTPLTALLGVPLVDWIARESERIGIKPHALRMRLSRGSHPMPPIVKLNQRRVFVMDGNR